MYNSKEFETRNTIYMDKGLKIQIDDICEKKNWSFSHACYVMLQRAVKELNRKKTKKTESGQ